MDLEIYSNFTSLYGYFNLTVATLSDVSSAGGWKGFTQGEVEKIRSAIESSGQFDWIKDCLLPILFALVGGMVAVYVNRTQDLNLTAKERVYAVNALVIRAEFALNSLNSLKQLYSPHMEKADAPYRAFEVPLLKYTFPSFNVDTSNLGFIFRNKKKSSAKRKWSETARINALFVNFQLLANQLIDIQATRMEINEIIFAATNDPRPAVDVRWLHQQMGSAEFASFFFMFEYFVKFADDLIIEFNEFLSEFPTEVEAVLGKSAARRYGLIIYEGPAGHLKLHRCQEPSYKDLARHMHMTEEEVKQRLYTAYSWVDASGGAI